MQDSVSSHTISVLVDNEPGILARVVGLFSGRGYNIDSLTVSETESQKHLSRITIVTTGTPMVIEQNQPATAPAWTAIEVARSLRRPRVLATLDAALRSGTCDRVELLRAVIKQSGRRGIVVVRELLPLADPRAESPMESEARLVMIDGGLPMPELQYEVIDGRGKLRRLDFAWPQYQVAAEYDGLDWHSGPDAMLADRGRTSALMDVGWAAISMVFEDVRYRPDELVARIDAQFRRARAA